MRSHPGSALRGFTLIELALTVGLVASLLSFGAIVGSSDRESSVLRSERDTLAALLRTARARSMLGVNGPAHGVQLQHSGCAIAERCYVLYSGLTFDSSAADSVIAVSETATVIEWPVGGFLFVTAGSREPESVTISTLSGSKSRSISVNEEGGISYE